MAMLNKRSFVILSGLVFTMIGGTKKKLFTFVNCISEETICIGEANSKTSVKGLAETLGLTAWSILEGDQDKTLDEIRNTRAVKADDTLVKELSEHSGLEFDQWLERGCGKLQKLRKPKARSILQQNKSSALKDPKLSVNHTTLRLSNLAILTTVIPILQNEPVLFVKCSKEACSTNNPSKYGDLTLKNPGQEIEKVLQIILIEWKKQFQHEIGFPAQRDQIRFTKKSRYNIWIRQRSNAVSKTSNQSNQETVSPDRFSTMSSASPSTSVDLTENSYSYDYVERLITTDYLTEKELEAYADTLRNGRTITMNIAARNTAIYLTLGGAELKLEEIAKEENLYPIEIDGVIFPLRASIGTKCSFKTTLILPFRFPAISTSLYDYNKINLAGGHLMIDIARIIRNSNGIHASIMRVIPELAKDLEKNYRRLEEELLINTL